MAIVLLAPALGGATVEPCQALILILIALLAGLFPPKRVDPAVVLAGGGLLIMGTLAFVPAHWVGNSAWRVAALRTGIVLPQTLTPQPWVSLHALSLLFAGLLWFAWITEQGWSPQERRVLARGFCCGAALLSLVAILAYYRNYSIPYWLKTERQFGPFPNRNQTANFFALSALVALAVAQEKFHRHEGKWRAGVWSLVAGVILWGLVMSYSRAGIAVFFLGALIWVLKFAGSYKRIALGGVFILVLLTGFFLFGGETLDRLLASTSGDFRFKIYRDALCMIGKSPWLGAGLGNFESVFPFFRNVSFQQERILHPESDWLWLATESGLPAVLFVFCGVAATFRRVFPFERRTARSLRIACASAAIIFMVHGFADVSGHRLGSVLPAIFVFALALHRPTSGGENLSLTPWSFRLGACLVLATALLDLQAKPLEKEVGRTLMSQNDYRAAVTHLTLALDKTPMDWETYYLRGTAHAFLHQWLEAVADFRRANLLEPVYQRLPIQEAGIWMNLDPGLVVPACKEALQRCRADEKADVFLEILDIAKGNRDLVNRLGDLAIGSSELEISFLNVADRDRANEIVGRLLPYADRLAPERRKRLYFAAARLKAQEKEFESAYKIARKGIFMPALPNLGKASLEESQREFTKDPSNFAAGYLLYTEQMKNSQLQDALFTLQKAIQEKNHPLYFELLAADLYATLESWDKAWEALLPFLR